MVNLLTRAFTAGTVSLQKQQCRAKAASAEPLSAQAVSEESSDSLLSKIRDSLARAKEDKPQDERRLTEIKAKLESGRKLSFFEKQYLRVADPLTYNDLLASECEQKQYERALQRCRNREEVAALKLGRLTTAYVNVKNISSNPHIQEEDRLKFCSMQQRRTEQVEKSTAKFTQSREYQDLPTREEERVHQQEIRQAERARLSGLSDKDCAPKHDGLLQNKSEEALRQSERGVSETENYALKQQLFSVDGTLKTYQEILQRIRRTRTRLGLMPKASSKSSPDETALAPKDLDQAKTPA
ncbi:MAG: hypothetical protein K6F05_06295 [Succinivibrio sp.]|nr:hypothetical protein [Succinivibrio sp.]